jgi:hypothetical protein
VTGRGLEKGQAVSLNMQRHKGDQSKEGNYYLICRDRKKAVRGTDKSIEQADTG